MSFLDNKMSSIDNKNLGPIQKILINDERDISHDDDIQQVVNYTYGNRKEPSIFSYGRSLFGLIGDHTIMMGASKEWDKQRILKGKLHQMQQIGGEVTILNTNSCDQIVGCYFSLPNFYQKIEEMGGEIVDLTLRLNHIFFQKLEPITIQNGKNPALIPAVRLPYDISLEKEFTFKNRKEFIHFCFKNRMQVFWETTFDEATKKVKSWYHLSFEYDNMIIVCAGDARRIKNINKDNLSIKKTDKFAQGFEIFDPELKNGTVILFNRNVDQIKSLFSIENRGLKIENAGWEIIDYENSVIFSKDSKLAFQLHEANTRQLNLFSFYALQTQNINLEKLKNVKAGVVILSMNQTSSFTQYSHEILTFLFMGMNVFAYDNAGKGLSQGKNTESGMMAAAISAGRFLMNHFAFNRKQLVFKGQCSGALPMSSAVTNAFPSSIMWADQSPNYYPSAVQKMAKEKTKELVKKTKKFVDNKEKEEATLGKITKTVFPIIGYTMSKVSAISTAILPGTLNDLIHNELDDLTVDNTVPSTVSYAVSIASSLILPSYNIANNFKSMWGVKIYTIGVPDNRNRGGDQLVPKRDVENIKKVLHQKTKGYFIPMPGATHVTDWWKDPEVYKKIKLIFVTNKLLCNPLENKQNNIVEEKKNDA